MILINPEPKPSGMVLMIPGFLLLLSLSSLTTLTSIRNLEEQLYKGKATFERNHLRIDE